MKRTPQFNIDQIYISPLTRRREWDETQQTMVYRSMVRNLQPTGIGLFDELCQRMSKGKFQLPPLAQLWGVQSSEINGFVHLLTGMSYPELERRWKLRMTDELLRYTNLSLTSVAHRVGFQSFPSFSNFVKRQTNQSPTLRRAALRQPGDIGRYSL